MNDYKLGIFDLDGTLIDSEAMKRDVFKSVFSNYMAFDKGMQNKLDEVGRHKFIKTYLTNQLCDNELNQLNSDISRLTLDVGLKCSFIEGAELFLQKCKQKGICLFLVSATPQYELSQIVAKRFKSTFEGYETAPPEKKSNVFVSICKKYNTQPVDAFSIGDRHTDQTAARIAGVKFSGLKSSDSNFDGFENIHYFNSFSEIEANL